MHLAQHWARDWRALALTQVHHWSRLSDSREDGEALRSVHSTALAAGKRTYDAFPRNFAKSVSKKPACPTIEATCVRRRVMGPPQCTTSRTSVQSRRRRACSLARILRLLRKEELRVALEHRVVHLLARVVLDLLLHDGCRQEGTRSGRARAGSTVTRLRAGPAGTEERGRGWWREEVMMVGGWTGRRGWRWGR